MEQKGASRKWSLDFLPTSPGTAPYLLSSKGKAVSLRALFRFVVLYPDPCTASAAPCGAGCVAGRGRVLDTNFVCGVVCTVVCRVS